MTDEERFLKKQANLLRESDARYADNQSDLDLALMPLSDWLAHLLKEQIRVSLAP